MTDKDTPTSRVLRVQEPPEKVTRQTVVEALELLGLDPFQVPSHLPVTIGGGEVRFHYYLDDDETGRVALLGRDRYREPEMAMIELVVPIVEGADYDGELLSVADAAGRLDMTVTHLSRLLAEGRIDGDPAVGVPAGEVDRILSARAGYTR